jgi:hypothetical protein
MDMAKDRGTGPMELPRFRGQVSVLVLWSCLQAALLILPDSESAAAGGRSSAILALA